jgi:hypothetical protein
MSDVQIEATIVQLVEMAESPEKVLVLDPELEPVRMLKEGVEGMTPAEIEAQRDKHESNPNKSMLGRPIRQQGLISPSKPGELDRSAYEEAFENNKGAMDITREVSVRSYGDSTTTQLVRV